VGGIIIGVFTPLLTGSAAVLMEAWTPQASTELIRKHGGDARERCGAIHAALITEAKADPDAYKTVRDFPSGGIGAPAPAARRAEGSRPVEHRDDCRLRHDRSADRVADRHRRPRRREALRRGLPGSRVTMKLIDREGNEVARRR